MVEFALIAPLFFLLLFSIIEFGRAVYYIQMLNSAAREGARYAIVHGQNALDPSGPFPPAYVAEHGQNTADLPGDDVIAVVKAYAIGVLDTNPTDFVVDVRWCDEDGDVADCPDNNAAGKGDGHNGRNQTVVVDVRYVFRPFIAGIVPLPTFTLSGGSTLVVNN
jgi:Flp pilus assembly protein TadG